MNMIKSTLKKYLSRNKFGDDIWYWLHIINVNSKRIIPDKKFFEISYKKSHSKRKINWDNPVTFDEKQLWLKLYYRNPLCIQCSDKYLAREYVKKCGYGEILNELYAVYDSVDDIKWDSLPSRYYMKTNHMSGCNVRCNDTMTFDRKDAIKRLKRGMHHDYSIDSREWNYKKIKRKIIVEKIIEGSKHLPLIDFRFLCYGGECKFLFVDIGTANDEGKHLEDARRNVYDRNMNILDVKVSRDTFPEYLVKKPENYEEMVTCAEKLSGNFPFCRVDLYNVEGKIIFGEITFFHSGGISSIYPLEWEEILGNDISIDLAKKQINSNYIDCM